MTDLAAGRDLVRRWRDAQRAAPPDAAGSWPLSSAQQGIWGFERLHPGSPVFHLCFAAERAGQLDRDRFDAAVAALIQRHPALRSTFADGPDGPVQEVHPAL